jgi:hypothetical protein
MAAGLYATDEEQQQSLLFPIVDAIAFWMRSPLLFWIVALPIAGLAAGVAYIFDTNQSLAEFQNHWGWDFLFALIYAMFLDRWIKASLLDDASPCDEVDNLRRSVVSPRFLGLAAVFFLLALVMSDVARRYAEVDIVLWSAAAALVALYLPALSAAEPVSLRRAVEMGRPVQTHLFLLIAGAVAVCLLAGLGFGRLFEFLPPRSWHGPALAALQQIVICLVLAIAGHVLAALFRAAADWRAPEPDDHPYRNMGLRRRTLSR